MAAQHRTRTAVIGWLVASAVLSSPPAMAQQVPDRTYRPQIAAPVYPPDEGPIVCVDEAHHNFHTLSERFWAFGELLRRAGYRPHAFKAPLTRESLAGCGVFVTSNAQPSEREWSEYPYPTPAAFSDAEVNAASAWVREGGALLLIADHMPLAGAAASLAAAFGVEFADGFAVEDFASSNDLGAAFARPTLFRTDDGTLRPHAVVRGGSSKESVRVVRSFTGQAFRAPDAAPLMVLPPTFVLLLPEKAWEFGPETRKVPAGGWLQGAAMIVEAGRAAFFGEAAMFSAQAAGPERRPVGMNAPGAEQNAQFVLNVMRWLTGDLSGDSAAH